MNGKKKPSSHFRDTNKIICSKKVKGKKKEEEETKEDRIKQR